MSGLTCQLPWAHWHSSIASLKLSQALNSWVWLWWSRKKKKQLVSLTQSISTSLPMQPSKAQLIWAVPKSDNSENTNWDDYTDIHLPWHLLWFDFLDCLLNKTTQSSFALSHKEISCCKVWVLVVFGLEGISALECLHASCISFIISLFSSLLPLCLQMAWKQSSTFLIHPYLWAGLHEQKQWKEHVGTGSASTQVWCEPINRKPYFILLHK